MAPHFVKHDSNGPGKVMVLSSIHSYLSWPQCKDKVTKEWELKWGRPLSERGSPSMWSITPTPRWLLPTPAVFWPWTFSSFMLQAGPRRSGFHYCFWRKSCQFQLGTEKSLDRHWKWNAFIFFFFLPSLPFQDRDQEKTKLLSFANPAVPLFVEMTLMLFIEFPFFIRIWTFPCKISLGSGRKSL